MMDAFENDGIYENFAKKPKKNLEPEDDLQQDPNQDAEDPLNGKHTDNNSLTSNNNNNDNSIEINSNNIEVNKSTNSNIETSDIHTTTDTENSETKKQADVKSETVKEKVKKNKRLNSLGSIMSNAMQSAKHKFLQMEKENMSAVKRPVAKESVPDPKVTEISVSIKTKPENELANNDCCIEENYMVPDEGNENSFERSRNGSFESQLRQGIESFRSRSVSKRSSVNLSDSRSSVNLSDSRTSLLIEQEGCETTHLNASTDEENYDCIDAPLINPRPAHPQQHSSNNRNSQNFDLQNRPTVAHRFRNPIEGMQRGIRPPWQQTTPWQPPTIQNRPALPAPRSARLLIPGGLPQSCGYEKFTQKPGANGYDKFSQQPKDEDEYDYVENENSPCILNKSDQAFEIKRKSEDLPRVVPKPYNSKPTHRQPMDPRPLVAMEPRSPVAMEQRPQVSMEPRPPVAMEHRPPPRPPVELPRQESARPPLEPPRKRINPPIEAPKQFSEPPKGNGPPALDHRKPVEPSRPPIQPPRDPIQPPRDPIQPPREPIQPPREPIQPPREPIQPPREPIQLPREPIHPPREQPQPFKTSTKPPPGTTSQNHLHCKEWYHEITRDQSVRLLKDVKKEGCFIIRNSKQGEGYSISILHQSEVEHLRIHSKCGGFYLGSSDTRFSTVEDLVKYFKNNALSLKTGTSVYLTCSPGKS